MLGALTGIFNSEKGLIGIALIIGVTILCAVGSMTVEQWTEYTKWIFGFYVSGKTIQGAASVIANALTSKAINATTTTTVDDTKATTTTTAS